MAASKQKVKLEDGRYDALWSAYSLTILSPDDNSELITIKTIMGIKTLNHPEKVDIKDGIVSFYYNKSK